MEKIFTLKELEALKKKSIRTACQAIKDNTNKNERYTAKELAEKCGGVMNARSIAARVSAWGRCGRYVEACINGGVVRIVYEGQTATYVKKRYAELDDNGNIVRTFEKEIEHTVGKYSVQ